MTIYFFWEPDHSLAPPKDGILVSALQLSRAQPMPHVSLGLLRRMRCTSVDNGSYVLPRVKR